MVVGIALLLCTLSSAWALSPANISTGHVCFGAKSGTFQWTLTADTRTGTTDNLPYFKVYDYCPFGQGGLYCGVYAYCPTGNYGYAGENCMGDTGLTFNASSGAAWGTITSQNSDCPSAWASSPCPTQTAAINGNYFDCPLSSSSTWTIPLSPKPRSKNTGPGFISGQDVGFALDGISIFDSFEGTGSTLDDAHIVQDPCGGHPTPGLANAQYHYHHAPICAATSSAINNGEPTPYNETQGVHSPLLGWGADGFGIYGFQDNGGSGAACVVTCTSGVCSDTCNSSNYETCHDGHGHWTGDIYMLTSGRTGTCERNPITDGCGGHFGPTPDSPSTLSYHYHSRWGTPYTLGCKGPSWGVCTSIYSGERLKACKSECASANLVRELCVASGYTEAFNSTVVPTLFFSDGSSFFSSASSTSSMSGMSGGGGGSGMGPPPSGPPSGLPPGSGPSYSAASSLSESAVSVTLLLGLMAGNLLVWGGRVL